MRPLSVESWLYHIAISEAPDNTDCPELLRVRVKKENSHILQGKVSWPGRWTEEKWLDMPSSIIFLDGEMEKYNA
jgi:hypothetical protein